MASQRRQVFAIPSQRTWIFRKTALISVHLLLYIILHYILRSRVSVVGIATTLRAGRSGVRLPIGARFSAPVQRDSEAHPDSYTTGTATFPGVKRPGRGVEHPHPSSAEVKERVELYLYSPSGPSWPVLGWNLPLYHIIYHIISYHIVSYHIISYCIIYYITLHCIALHYIILYYIILYYIILYYIILYYIILLILTGSMLNSLYTSLT